MKEIYIIYPGGDKSKLEVIELHQEELACYSIASRRSFLDLQSAISYMKDLSVIHGKSYSLPSGYNDYLD